MYSRSVHLRSPPFGLIMSYHVPTKPHHHEVPKKDDSDGSAIHAKSLSIERLLLEHSQSKPDTVSYDTFGITGYTFRMIMT